MSVARRGIVGAIWNYAGNFTRLALQFGTGVLLARLLGPEPFGIVAVMFLLISVGQLFSDFGFSSAIVQAKALTPDDVRAASGAQIALGLFLTVLTFVCAGLISKFFGQRGATGPIEAMAAIFFIRSLGQTPTALLTREMRFGAIQTSTIVAYIIGYIAIGVPMALGGYGAWSLVIAQLVQSIVASAAAVALAGGIPIPHLRFKNMDFLAFGSKVIKANMSSWAFSNLDALVIGHVFSGTTLGYYNRAYNLASSIASAITGSAQSVLFASASRAQDNSAAIVRVVLACMQFFLLTAGSVLLTIAAVTPAIVELLYGSAWLPVAPLLTPLALAMTLQGLLAFFGPALMALGQTNREVRAQVLGLIVMVPVLLICCNISARAVAWGVAFVLLVRLLLLFRQFQQVLSCSTIALARALLFPFLVAVAVAGMAATGQHLMAEADLVLRVEAIVAGAIAGGVLALLILRRALLDGPLGDIYRQSAKFGTRLAGAKGGPGQAEAGEASQFDHLGGK